MDNLEKCPFCGGKAALETKEPNNDYPNARVFSWAASCGCSSCQMWFRTSRQYKTEPEAAGEVVNLWNRRANGWIDIEDKHPGGDVVIVFDNPIKGFSEVATAKFMFGQFVEPVEEYAEYLSVTHWMPLPKPPTTKED